MIPNKHIFGFLQFFFRRLCVYWFMQMPNEKTHIHILCSFANGSTNSSSISILYKRTRERCRKKYTKTTKQIREKHQSYSIHDLSRWISKRDFVWLCAWPFRRSTMQKFAKFFWAHNAQCEMNSLCTVFARLIFFTKYVWLKFIVMTQCAHEQRAACNAPTTLFLHFCLYQRPFDFFSYSFFFYIALYLWFIVRVQNVAFFWHLFLFGRHLRQAAEKKLTWLSNLI